MRIPAQVRARKSVVSSIPAHIHSGGDCADGRLDKDRPDSRNHILQLATQTIDPTCSSPLGLSLSDRLWRWTMRYDLERDCAFTSLAWGIWVTFLQPISSSNPSVRGLRLLNDVFSWLPFPSDIAWGVMLIVPAVTQFVYMTKPHKLKIRIYSMWMQALVFLSIVYLLAVDNWRTTGIPIYGALAIGQIIRYMQLSRTLHCGNDG